MRTEADGAVRPYFSRHRADRFVSAIDVLEGRVDPSLLSKQMVLIGPSAVGLEEMQDTPIGERMSVSEIHAQLLENLLDGSSLRRPAWAAAAEALLVLLSGALLAWALPRMAPRNVALLLLALVAVAGAGRVRRLSHARPAARCRHARALAAAALRRAADARADRVDPAAQVARGRRPDAARASARIAGELEAAQRIQTASLPRPDLLRGDARADLHAALTPAREVGGDLYDFFMLDGRRLFLLIGDVAGKGLSASIFMAVSKALYKGLMLRTPRADIGDIMTAADAEVSRDNAEMLFVTVFAAILDLESGELSYCNAGHDNPYLLRRGDAAPRRIVDGDGPPLCATSDFVWRSARCRLVPGDVLSS